MSTAIHIKKLQILWYYANYIKKKERHNFLKKKNLKLGIKNKTRCKNTFWQIVFDQIDHRIRNINCLFEYFRGGDVRNKTNQNHFDKELLL